MCICLTSSESKVVMQQVKIIIIIYTDSTEYYAYKLKKIWTRLYNKSKLMFTDSIV